MANLFPSSAMLGGSVLYLPVLTSVLPQAAPIGYPAASQDPQALLALLTKSQGNATSTSSDALRQALLLKLLQDSIQQQQASAPAPPQPASADQLIQQILGSAASPPPPPPPPPSTDLSSLITGLLQPKPAEPSPPPPSISTADLSTLISGLAKPNPNVGALPPSAAAADIITTIAANLDSATTDSTIAKAKEAPTNVLTQLILSLSASAAAASPAAAGAGATEAASGDASSPLSGLDRATASSPLLQILIAGLGVEPDDDDSTGPLSEVLNFLISKLGGHTLTPDNTVQLPNGKAVSVRFLIVMIVVIMIITVSQQPVSEYHGFIKNLITMMGLPAMEVTPPESVAAPEPEPPAPVEEPPAPEPPVPEPPVEAPPAVPEPPPTGTPLTADDNPELFDKLKDLGQCPQGLTWNKVEGGWRCSGGGHFVDDAALA